jgi:hypothetical protein
MNHGVVVVGESYEFWWMGEQVGIEDFNARLMSATQEIGTYVQGMREGMDLRAMLNEGQKTVAQLDTLEEVARLPLCDSCRKLIGKVEDV